jgi:Usher syndrome type-1G protein
MTCVTFLVNYGVNLWAKDIDFHTPTDLAAMNDRQDILRFLDDVAAKEERKNSKKVKSLKEKAQKDAEKRVKEFGQVQEKARKLAEKEKKRLDKERQRMETSVADSNGDTTTTSATVGNPIPRPSMAALGLRRDSRLVYANQSQKFSDLVGTTRDHRETRPKLPGGAVFKKVQQQQIKKMLGSKKSPGDTLSKSSTTLNEVPGEDDFKVGAIEDGKRSVRSITGLRRDSEVMYVPRFESNPTGKFCNLQ